MKFKKYKNLIILSLTVLGIYLNPLTSNAINIDIDAHENNYETIDANLERLENSMGDIMYGEDGESLIEEGKVARKEKSYEEKIMQRLKGQVKKENNLKRINENKGSSLLGLPMQKNLHPESKPYNFRSTYDKIIGRTSINSDIAMIQNIANKNIKSMSLKQIELIKSLPRYLGKPYVWGATGPSSYDCSGFTQSIFRDSLGINIPRVANDQFMRNQNKIPLDKLLPGDLVFFERTDGRPNITHVGLYIGDGVMVHASSSYDSVKTEFVMSKYFKNKYAGAVRYY